MSGIGSPVSDEEQSADRNQTISRLMSFTIDFKKPILIPIGCCCLALVGFLPTSAFADSEGLPAEVRQEYDTICRSFDELLNEVNLPIAKLGTSYKAALEKHKLAAQASGNLQNVIASATALKSFDEGETPAGKSGDPEIDKLGNVYLAERAKLDEVLRGRQLAVWNKHRKDVDTLVKRLTKDAKIEAAKIVNYELEHTDSSIELLKKQSAKSEEKPIGQSWVGEWKVDFDNDTTRIMRITNQDLNNLNIEAVSGFYATGEKYSAKWDQERVCFISTRGTGESERSESYTLQKNQILIKHWWGKYTYEKPEVKGTARKTKER